MPLYSQTIYGGSLRSIATQGLNFSVPILQQGVKLLEGLISKKTPAIYKPLTKVVSDQVVRGIPMFRRFIRKRYGVGVKKTRKHKKKRHVKKKGAEIFLPTGRGVWRQKKRRVKKGKGKKKGGKKNKIPTKVFKEIFS